MSIGLLLWIHALVTTAINECGTIDCQDFDFMLEMFLFCIMIVLMIVDRHVSIENWPNFYQWSDVHAQST